MDLALSDDQQAVAELAATFFARESTIERIRAAARLGHDQRLWDALQQTGLVSMSLGEEVGGGGVGLLEAVLVAEQAGHHLAPVPLVEHIVAARLMERHRAALPADELAAVVSGDRIATLAIRPTVDGVARLVPAGAVADHVIVFDPDTGTLTLWSGTPSGRALANVADLPLADRTSAGSTVIELASGQQARAAFAAAVDEWRILTAAALVGLSAAALELGVEYVKRRHQFDVPIGSFQSVKHGLAEFPGRIAGARLLTQRAAWGVDGGVADNPDQTDPSRQAPMALLFAADLAIDVTYRTVHYHGGYGVMEEEDAQLYYRRAKGWPLLLASPDRELEHLASVVLGPKGGS